MNWKRRYRRLEQRVLLDAAGAVTVAETESDNTPEAVREAAREALQQEQDDLTSLIVALGESRDNADTGPPAPAERHEILFIDDQLSDIDQLLDNLSDDVEVYHIESNEDGVAFIADVLANSEKIYDAVHIVSHGDSGELRLGNAILTRANLAGETLLHIQSWGESITDEGDILIYGCRVAEGDSGESLVKAISVLTGADIAASTDDTGAAAMGGDWDFEVRAGEVETDIAFPGNTRVQWGHLFAPDPPTDATGNQPTLTPATATVTEDTAVDDNGNLAATGTLSSAGADNTQFKPENIIGAHGVLDIDADGAWSYKAPNGQTEIQELNSGESLTDTLTVTSADNVTTTTVTITIIGVNEATAPDPAAPGTTRQPGPTQQPSRTDPGQQPAPNQQNGNPNPAPAKGGATGQQNGNPDDQQPANPAAPDGPTAQQDPDPNNPPTAAPDQGVTDEDSVLTVAGSDTGTTSRSIVYDAGLLQNDSDPDGDDLTITAVGQNLENQAAANVDGATRGSNGGSFTISANGAYSFDPGTDFNGLKSGENATTSVTYTVSDRNDGTGLTATATLTITVTGADDVPTLTPVTVTLIEDTALTDGNLVASGTVTTTGGDTGDDSFQPQTATKGSVGTLSITAAGAWSYTAANNHEDIQALGATDSLTDTFTVTSADTVTTTSVTITITGTNDAPSAVNDLGTTVQNVPLTVANDAPGDLLLNDSDPESDSLSITGVSGFTDAAQDGSRQPQNVAAGVATRGSNGGEFTISANGAWSFNPDGDFDDLVPGTTTTTQVTYTVTDGSLTASATLTVTVTTPNRAPTPTADQGETAENTIITVDDGATGTNGNNADLLLNDSDPDGDSLRITDVQGAGRDASGNTRGSNGGAFAIETNGAWNFYPGTDFDDLTPDETRDTTVTYTVFDGSLTASTTLTVTVTGEDDVPVLSTGSATLTEDTALTDGNLVAGGTVTSSGGDADESGFQAQTATKGTVGSFTITAAGAWSYTAPNSHADIQALGTTESLTDTFIVTSADTVTTTSVTITINGANDGPTANDDVGTALSDTATTVANDAPGDLLLNDSDPDGDSPLKITQVGATITTQAAANLGKVTDGSNGGEFTINADGSYTFDPDGDFDDLAQGASKTTSVVYTMTDPGGLTDTATLTITVTPPVTPSATDDVGATTENTKITVADGDKGTTTNGVTTNADLLLNDSHPDDATLTITNFAGAALVNAGATTAGTGGGSFTIRADGSWEFDPGTSFDDLATGKTRTTSVAYTVAGDGATDRGTLTVTVTGVNDAPTAKDDTGAAGNRVRQLIADGDTGTTSDGVTTNADLLLNDSDPDGDGLTISAAGTSATSQAATNLGKAIAGSDGGLFTIRANGAWAFTHNDAFADLALGASRTTSAVYTITDGNGGTSTATITVTVSGVIQTLVARDDYASITEGDGFLFVRDGAVGTTRTVVQDGVSVTITERADLLLNDFDPEGDTLTITKVHAFTVDGKAQTVAQGVDTFAGNGGQIRINADGSYVFFAAGPDFSDLGQDETRDTTVSYTVSDGNGNTAIGTLTITVSGVNNTPDAFPDLGATDANTVLTVKAGDTGIPGTTQTLKRNGITDYTVTTNANPLLNDIDVNNDPLHVAGVGPVVSILAANVGKAIDGSNGGTFTLNRDGSYTFDPDGDFNDLHYDDTPRTTLVYYRAGDEHGAALNGLSHFRTLTISVTGTNYPPVAVDDLGTTDEQTTLTVSDGDTATTTSINTGDGTTRSITGNADLLLNDTDPDGNTNLSITEVGIGVDPLHANNLGTATLGDKGGHFTIRADGSWTFVPGTAFSDLEAGESRDTSINYRLSDNRGGTDIGTVTVTVTGANTIPTAQNEQGRLDSDETLTIAADAKATTVEGDRVSGGLLQNAKDAEGDSIRVFQVFDYGKNANQYRPVPEGGSVTVQGHAGGQITVHSDGAWSFNPDGDFASASATTATVSQTTFRITDDGTRQSPGYFLSISVYGPNDAPVAVDDTGVTNDNSRLTVADGAVGTIVTNDDKSTMTVNADLLLNDTDANGDSLSIISAGTDAASLHRNNLGRAITGSNGGSFFIGADGAWAFDPANHKAFRDLAAGESLTTSVAYRISDGRYESANTATLTVTVNGVNDAPLTVADTGATTQNAVLTVNAAQGILANDADPEGDTLTVSRIFNFATAGFVAVPAGGSLTLPGGNGGSFTISADGAYSFDPGTDFNDLAATKTRQSAMFYYAVDANGAEAAAHRFLRVTVTGANDAPTPVDDVARSLENSKITVPDGDKGVTSIRSGVKTVRNADLLLNDTDPDTGDTATLTISAAGTSATSQAVGNLGNAIDGSNGGTFTISATGAWNFDPGTAFDDLGAGATRTTSVVYTVTDVTGATDTATLTVTVAGLENSPVAIINPATTDNDQVLTVPATAAGVVLTDIADGVAKRHNVGLLVGASDAEGDPLSISAVFDPVAALDPAANAYPGLSQGPVTVAGIVGTGTGGLFTIHSTGAWSFNPNGDFDDLAAGETATVTLRYRVSAGGVTAATLTLTVTPPNVEPVAVNDFGTATENGVRSVADGATGSIVTNDDKSTMTVNADLLLNDTDPEGDDLSISAVAGNVANVGKATDGSNGGSFTISANGAWSFAAGNDFEDLPVGGTRTTSITYTLYDGNETDTATLTVTVSEVNDRPTAVADTARAPSTSGLTVDAAAGVLANDRDPEGETLRVSSVYEPSTRTFKTIPVGGSVTLTGGQGGSLTLHSDGSWSFSPSGDFRHLAGDGKTSPTAFPYRITDARGAESALPLVSLSITLFGENDPPQAVDDSGATTENTKITVADGATGTIVTNADKSTMTINADLLLNDLDPDDPDLFDGMTEQDTLAIIAVGKAEDRQSANNLGVAIDGSDGGSFTIQANGAWSFDPGTAFDDLGVGETRTTSVAYTVEDINETTDVGTLTVTVTGADDAPVVATNPATTDNNQRLTVAAAATGVLRTDANGALTRHNVGLLVGATDIEGDSIRVLSVDDGGAKAVPAGGSVTVEPASGGIFIIHADGAWSFDPDGDFASLGTVTETGASSVTLQVGNPDNAATELTTVTLSVTVTRPNDAPVAADNFGTVNEDSKRTVPDADPGTVITNPDSSTMTINADLLLNDADANSDPLTISAVGGKAAGVGSAVDGSSGGSFTLDKNGGWTFDPDDDFEDLAPGKTRTTSVTYTVTDGRDTDTATLTVTVSETNDVPTVADDTGATRENAALNVAKNAPGTTVNGITTNAGLLENDKDAEAEAFSITGIKGYGDAAQDGTRPAQNLAPGVATQGSKGGTFTVSADGAWRFDPGTEFNSLSAGKSIDTTVEYRVTDARSGVSDYATLTVTVTGLNDAPTAVDDAANTPRNQRLIVADGATGTTTTADGPGSGGGAQKTVTTNADLLLNDSDPDSTDTLTITRINDVADNIDKTVIGTNGGTFVIQADGSYTFDPRAFFRGLAAGATATTSVTYTVEDANGGSDTATLTVTVTGHNTPPAVASDIGRVDSDETLTIAADDEGTVVNGVRERGGLLVNDSDTDGDTIRVWDVINYPADGSGAVRLPVPEGGSVTVRGHVGGTFTVHSDGAWAFDPGTDFAGIGTALVLTQTAYTITDDGTSNSISGFGFIQVYVSRPNTAPVALNDAGTTPETTVLIVADGATGTTSTADGVTVTTNADLLLNDTDADGDGLSISAVGGVAGNVGKATDGTNGGSFTINTNGSYTFNPGSAFDDLGVGQSRATSVTYTITDGGDSDTATLTVTVTGVNTAPTGSQREWFTNEDVPLKRSTDRNLLVTGTDPEGDALRITQVYYRNDDLNTLPLVVEPVPDGGMVTLQVYGPSLHRPYHGRFTIWSDGTWEYDPDGAFDDLVTGRLITTLISYQITDAHGATNAADANGVLRVSVRGVNSAPDAGDDFGETTENTKINVADGATGTVVTRDGATMTVHADLLLNDSDGESDPIDIIRVDGHRDRIGTARPGSNGGIFTISADGSWSFDPDGDPDNDFNDLAKGETRTTWVTYTIGDGNAGDDQARLTVTVTGLNDAPTGLPNYDPNVPAVVGEALGNLKLNVPNGAEGTVEDGKRINADLLTGAKDVDGGLTITQVGTVRNELQAPGLFSHLNGDRWLIRPDGSWLFLSGDRTNNDPRLNSPDGSLTRTAYYTVSDGGGFSETLALTVTIRRANDAPVAVADVGTTPENAVLEVKDGATGTVVTDPADSSTMTVNRDLLLNDTDPNRDSLTISAVRGYTPGDTDGTYKAQEAAVAVGTPTLGSNGGTFTIAADGSYTFNPNGDFDDLAPGKTETTSVIVTTTDGRDSDTATLTITVTGVDSPPVAVNDYGAVKADADLFVNFDAKGTLSGTMTVNAGLLQNDYDPEGDDNPEEGGTDLRIIRIFTVNDEGKEVASRPVPDGTGSARLNPASGGEFVVVFNGSWFFRPTGDFDDLEPGETRDTSVHYDVIHNGKKSTAILTVTVTGVNVAPVAAGDAGATTENAELTVADGAKGTTVNGIVTNADLLLNDRDPDDTTPLTNTLTITAVGGESDSVGKATDGSSGGKFTIHNDGSYSFDPGKEFDDLAMGKTRTTSVAYTVAESSETGALSHSATLTVTVTGENDPVTQVVNPLLGTAESVGKKDTVDATATGIVVRDDDGTITSITNAGLLSGFTDLDGDTLKIIAVNGQTGNVGREIFGQSSGGNGGRIQINADGSWHFDPTTTFNFKTADNERTTEAKFTVSDGKGSTVESTLSITVRRANMAPVAADDVGGTDQNTAIIVADGATGTSNADLLLNDADENSGDTLKITHIGVDEDNQKALTAADIGGSDGGLFRIRADGSWNFVPNDQFDDLAAGKTRTTSVVYTVSDGGTAADGTATADTATLTVTVTGVNDAPVAVADSGTASSDRTTTVADGATGTTSGTTTINADLLLNDEDVDDTSLTISKVGGQTANVGRAVDVAGGGRFTINEDGSWEFDPDGDFGDLTGSQTRTTSVGYTVSDDGGAMHTVRLTVTVSPNQAPVANNDLGATTDRLLIVADGDTGATTNGITTNADLLLNDRDPEAVPLTISAAGTDEDSQDAASVGSAVDGSNGGRFTIAADGAWRFDPNGDFDDLAPGVTPHHLGGLHRLRWRWPPYRHRHPDRDRDRRQRQPHGGR